MSSEHIDEVSGISTTGHEWDGIRELNNPLPRWWVITFYITVAWAVAYTIAYPAWPMLSSATKGVLGYSSRNAVKIELAAAEAAKGKYVAAIQQKTVSEIAADDALREFAVAAGGATFKVNCVQCHGSGAQGSKGFPNLNDDDWLWGGTTEQIQQTIAHGIRFASDPDTRQSGMPPSVTSSRPNRSHRSAPMSPASRARSRMQVLSSPAPRYSRKTASPVMAIMRKATKSLARPI